MANTTEEIDRMYSSIDEALESLERTFVARAEKKGSLEVLGFFGRLFTGCGIPSSQQTGFRDLEQAA